jgi:hypothetical protein
MQIPVAGRAALSIQLMWSQYNNRQMPNKVWVTPTIPCETREAGMLGSRLPQRIGVPFDLKKNESNETPNSRKNEPIKMNGISGNILVRELMTVVIAD